MSDQAVYLERGGHVATVCIERPKCLNALSRDVLAELAAAFETLEADPPRCVILRGGGEKAFVAGADITELAELDAAAGNEFARFGHRAFNRIEALECPVIAAVRGFALGGGCELALACDFIYAAESAVFGQPEVKLGFIPGFGGTQRLPRRVGIAMAREMIVRGHMIKADEALRMGLANAVLPDDGFFEAVEKIAGEIAQQSPQAVAVAKRVIREGEGRPLKEANALEIELFGDCFGTEDQKEGVQAFLEKRSPNFS